VTKDTEISEARSDSLSYLRQGREISGEQPNHSSDATVTWEYAPPEILSQLGALPDLEREVIVLYFLEGFSFPEIVAASGQSEWMVRRQLQLAVSRLRSAAA